MFLHVISFSNFSFYSSLPLPFLPCHLFLPVFVYFCFFLNDRVQGLARMRSLLEMVSKRANE
jgi:hypothetical protein